MCLFTEVTDNMKLIYYTFSAILIFLKIIFPPDVRPKVREKTFSRAPLRGSLTVEAAFILPLFFLSMTGIALAMNVLGGSVEKNIDLSNKARTAAMYAGAAGDTDLWVDLRSTYEYEIPISPFPLPKIRVPVRARVRVWSGKGSGTLSGNEPDPSDSETVYVTDYESVYHTDPECTHLSLSVRSVPYDRISKLRNIYGSRYRKCDGFPKDYTGPVYFTDKGDRYYPSPDYGGITRHVRIVKRSDVTNLRICQRCGGIH